MTPAAYGYRDDPAVPEFDDSRPLFVFDGTCVLCSGGASWIMRHDRHGRIALTAAQGELGRALYRHHAMEMDETYLFLAGGRAYGMSEGYFRVAHELGGFWRAVALLRIVPRPIRDAAYRMLARNRYRWFGQVGTCALLTAEQRRRLL
jgi:predicted DCC family thiol-disulfide oxidoreductase YuxK